MKFGLCIAAISSLCVGGLASAQSLERSYAQLCTGKSKSSETCQTLRKALADKLASESLSDTTPANSAAPGSNEQSTAQPGPRPYRGKAGVISPKWGFWSRLAGSTTVEEGDGSIRSYAWTDKGRVMGVDILARDKKTSNKLTLFDDGSIEIRPEDGEPAMLTPAGSGSFANGNDSVRWRYSLSGKSIVVAEEKRDGADWKPTGDVRRRTMVAARDVAGIKARMNADRLALDAQIAREWGPLGRAVGRRFLAQSKTNPKDDAYFGYFWRERGKVAELQWFHFTAGEPFAWTRFTRDPATGAITALSHDKRTATVSFEGETIRESTEKGSTQDVIDTTLRNGAFERASYNSKKGKRRNETTASYPDVTATPWTQLAEDFKKRAVVAQQAQAARQQAAASAPQKRGSSRGILGALGGAMMGSILSGGNVGSMVGGAMKGLAVVDPNSAAAGALGSAGDSILSKGAVSAMGGQSGATGALSALGGGGAGGGGQYPNLASQYCPGMTAGNYRTFALSGGSDRQLKTLCGQAFEYWNMTQNAVRQGYGPQDVERTYSAHRDSAAVVRQFVSEAR